MFAPGIPDKSKIKSIPKSRASTKTQFAIQYHVARRAGPHYDLRLHLGGVAKSWALRKLPQAPGSKTLAIQQPDHTTAYSTFSGTIPEGYGAGTVQLFRHGDAEVLYSRADQIGFITQDGEPERYTLVKTDGPNWLLVRNGTSPK